MTQMFNNTGSWNDNVCGVNLLEINNKVLFDLEKYFS